VRLPPGVLVPGTTYHVNVAAIEASKLDVEHHLFTTWDKVPYHRADTLTAFLTTP